MRDGLLRKETLHHHNGTCRGTVIQIFAAEAWVGVGGSGPGHLASHHLVEFVPAQDLGHAGDIRAGRSGSSTFTIKQSPRLRDQRSTYVISFATVDYEYITRTYFMRYAAELWHG
jgi:hypothetical protein